MPVVKLDERRSIGDDQPCFIIAEIGQNHQGDLAIAKEMIQKAKECGADCVKFQKTDINEKFNKGALKKEYSGANSWGENYGDHKRYLEFTNEEFVELRDFATDSDVYFSASAMDLKSLDFLADLNLKFIKIGSGDSNNFPILKSAASKNVPLIISTGMIDREGVEKIYNTIKEKHVMFCLLHCISAYPTPYEDCNLRVIQDYKDSFPDIPIGYSGHELGISVPVAAVALGAKIIEKHVTLDKTWKGTDHSSSLTPDEFAEMVRQIRIVEAALGTKVKVVSPSERPCMEKLQKTIVVAADLKKGAVLKEEDLKVKVAYPKGADGGMLNGVIGRVLNVDKAEDESIYFIDLV